MFLKGFMGIYYSFASQKWEWKGTSAYSCHPSSLFWGSLCFSAHLWWLFFYVYLSAYTRPIMAASNRGLCLHIYTTVQLILPHIKGRGASAEDQGSRGTPSYNRGQESSFFPDWSQKVLLFFKIRFYFCFQAQVHLLESKEKGKLNLVKYSPALLLLQPQNTPESYLSPL